MNEQAALQDSSSLIFFADSAKSAFSLKRSSFFFCFQWGGQLERGAPVELASHVAALSDFHPTVFDYCLTGTKFI